MPRLQPFTPSVEGKVSRPGQFGPTIRTSLRNASSTKYALSATGMPSVMTTISLMPASMASTTASLAKRGGTNTTLAWAPVTSTASAQLPNTRNVTSSPSLAAGKLTSWPALRALTPPTILVPASACGRYGSCLMSGHTLHDDRCAILNEKRHFSEPPCHWPQDARPAVRLLPWSVQHAD